MFTWRAVVWHIGLASLFPLYLTLKVVWNRDALYERSFVQTSVLILIWVWWITRYTIPFLTSPLRHLPSPRGEIFGLGHEHMLREVPMTDSILNACKATPNDGLLTFYQLFHSGPIVVPTTPEAVMEIVNARSYDWHKPGPDARLLRRILGNGLVVAEGQPHKFMRKAVAPAFSGKQIRDLVPLFYEKGRAFVEVLADKAPDGAVEVTTHMSKVTLDIIGSTGIGMDFDTIHNQDNKLAQLYEIITGPDRGPIVLFFLINAFLPPVLVENMYGTRYARVANAVRTLRHEVRGLLQEKKQSLEMKQQNDIIATIMRSGDFSDDYLCDQLLTFFAAGHDTTAVSLTWTLYLLSLHPEKQDILRKECQKLGDLNKLDAEELERLPYLNAVCNEVLRLYPPVPGTARRAVVNTKVGSQVLPKGTFCFIPMWTINRLPSLWGDDVNDFRPERWLDGPQASLGGAQSAYAFLTFLYGPRSCIGQQFARVEMKCLLLALIMRFRFELEDPEAEIKMTGFVTIKPANGLRLKLHDLARATKN